jgi:hypothetical protein
MKVIGLARVGAVGVSYALLAGAIVARVSNGKMLRRSFTARMPHEMTIAGASILPVRNLSRLLRRRRSPGAGRCRTCGYDLRATPREGGALLHRCPEWGTVVSVPTASPAAAATATAGCDKEIACSPA